MRSPRATIAGIALLSALGCGGVHTPDGESSVEQPPASAGAGAGTTTAGTLPGKTAESDAGSRENMAPSSGGSGGSQGGNTLEPPVEFCDAPAKLLVPHCGGGSCHSNKDVDMGDFAMNATQAYKYVDKLSSRNADCGRIIDSRDYSKSFILIKLRGELLSNVSEAVAESDPVHCGGRMPIGSFVIEDDLIDCMASWLQQFQAPR
jgi:hypothetical protein